MDEPYVPRKVSPYHGDQIKELKNKLNKLNDPNHVIIQKETSGILESIEYYKKRIEKDKLSEERL
ncbi:hypothetical protein ACI3PL_23440, partial [Lacticaseibacillus paracasei]